MRRRHVVFVGLAILLASTMTVGTGADTVTYEDVETLELQPAGGDSAYVDENGGDGEIRIRVNEGATASGAGVNDNAITDLGPVFTVRNLLENGAGNEVELFIEKNDSDGVIDEGENSVMFYNATGSTNERIDSSGGNVTLAPGENVSVGVRIDTTGTDDPESVVSFRLMAHVLNEGVFDTSSSAAVSSFGSDSDSDTEPDPVDSEVDERPDGEQVETGDASESISDPDSEQTDSGDGESSASTGEDDSNADGAGGDTQSGLGLIELAGFGSPLSLVAAGSSAVILSLSYIYRRRLAANGSGGWR